VRSGNVQVLPPVCADRLVRRGIPEAMVIENLDDLGFFESAEGLAGLIVIDQNQAQARRIEGFPLAADAEVAAGFIHDPEIAALLP
jgi:hypothetical protein